MRILVVDDDKAFCGLLAEVLEGKGHNVDWTTHPLEGFKLSQLKFYDLFVFDVRMPILAGTGLADGLREQSPGVKIILISAFAEDALKRKAKGLGVPLPSKPF